MSKTTMVYELLHDTLTQAGLMKDAPLYREAGRGLVWVKVGYTDGRDIFYPLMYDATVQKGIMFQIEHGKMNGPPGQSISFRDRQVFVGPRRYDTEIQVSELTWQDYEKGKDIDPRELIAKLTERIEKLERKLFPL